MIVLLVTFRLGTGKTANFFYSVHCKQLKNVICSAELTGMLYELELELNQEVMMEGQNHTAFSQPCAHKEQLSCDD